MCNLQPQVVANPNQVVGRLREWLDEPEPGPEIEAMTDLSGLLYGLLKQWGMKQFILGGVA